MKSTHCSRFKEHVSGSQQSKIQIIVNMYYIYFSDQSLWDGETRLKSGLIFGSFWTLEGN